MKARLLFTAGVIGIAVLAGVFQALNAPRRKTNKDGSARGEEHHKETMTGLAEKRK